MKHALLVAILVTGLAVTSASRAYGKEEAVTGQGSCGKAHETLIKVHEGERIVTYHLVNNDVTKAFHGKICKKPAQVKAEGDVETVDGRLELTPKSIELVKSKP